jgi:DNA polymerase-4
MSMQWALRLCPKALVVKGDMDRYLDFSTIITEVIEEQAPIFEKASIDEFYLDLSGMDRLHGCYRWASELREKLIKESGLPMSFALASNKTVSKVGSGEAKPNGRINIQHGKETVFLSPFPVRKIPGIGETFGQKLNLMGVRKIAELRNIPRIWLFREFGKSGDEMYWKAHGQDDSPVQPYHEQASLSMERTLETDTIDVMFLKVLLKSMCERLAYQLRQEKKLTSCVCVKIRYSDYQTHTRQKRLHWTSDDRVIQRVAEELFLQLFDRRIRLRLLGIKFSSLVPGKLQLTLFDKDEKDWALLGAMDKIRDRFGSKAIVRANTLHQP